MKNPRVQHKMPMSIESKDDIAAAQYCGENVTIIDNHDGPGVSTKSIAIIYDNKIPDSCRFLRFMKWIKDNHHPTSYLSS